MYRDYILSLLGSQEMLKTTTFDPTVILPLNLEELLVKYCQDVEKNVCSSIVTTCPKEQAYMWASSFFWQIEKCLNKMNSEFRRRAARN